MYTNTYSIYTKVLLYTFHKDRLSRCYFTLDFPEVLDCACDGGVIIFFCWGEGQDRLCFPVSMTNVLVAHHGFSSVVPAESGLVGRTGVPDRAFEDCMLTLLHRILSLQHWF